jgi:hypothetical protein
MKTLAFVMMVMLGLATHAQAGSRTSRDGSHAPRKHATTAVTGTSHAARGHAKPSTAHAAPRHKATAAHPRRAHPKAKRTAHAHAAKAAKPAKPAKTTRTARKRAAR